MENTKKPDIFVFSNLSEESHTIPALEKTAIKKGVKLIALDIDTSSIIRSKTGIEITDKTGKKYKIDPEKTAFLCRRGVVKNTQTRDLISDLQNEGFFVVNTLESIMICENKWTTGKLLEKAGIPTPKQALVYNESNIEPALKIIGGKFPVVLKMLSGSQGIGVSIVDSLASLKSVLQTIWKIAPHTECLIQEKIDSDHDLRIHVLTRKFNSPQPQKTDQVILGYMRRNQVEKDFRTNHSLGGTVEKTKITPEQEAIAIKSAKVVGTHWCGVDIIVDKKTGKNYVLEVNASPGTKGLKLATGIDVVSDIIDFLIDRENWSRGRSLEVGYREVIGVSGIGDFVAKLDTGNGALSSSLTYDEAEVSPDKKWVEWKIGPYSGKSKIVGWSEAEVGHQYHKRPIIYMDYTFLGREFKNIPTSLVDRTEKSTKLLINRDFLKKIGCSVNPYKTFLVTDLFDDEWGAKDSKGNNHSGIKFYKTNK